MEKQIWKIEGTNTGHVRIEMGGKAVLIASSDAGLLAAAILNCARAVSSENPDPGDVDWIPVEPTSITIGSGPLPEHEALVLAFGPALLAVSLHKRHLKKLGEAFLALSAEGSAQ